jgi:mono/diheme cytochrome c family protein
MNKAAQRWIFLTGVIALAITPMVDAQPTGSGIKTSGQADPGIFTNIVRHHQVMMYGIPASYRGLREQLPPRPADLKRGAAIFQHSCASCHGFSGHGDGLAAKQLISPPANLAWLAHTPMSRSGPYMYWTIAEGGQPVGSDMPAFKNSLSRNDIWAVIGYVQNGPSPVSNAVKLNRAPQTVVAKQWGVQTP